MSSSLPDFHSETLCAAVESASDIIENHDQVRDRLSDDIKNLEKYLETHAPKETFRVSFGKGFVATDDEQMIQASLEYSGGAGGEIHEDALVWQADSKGRFRLFYELSKWEGCIEVDVPGGPLFHDENTLVRESRPLIEMPFGIRKSMLPRLPEFVNALASYIAVDAESVTELDLDDIPF